MTTIAARCLDAGGAAMVRAPANGQVRANKERNAQARAKYRMMRQKSTLATFRNIPGNNSSVIMQTTQARNHKQRKRDNANNASVIMARVSWRHNAIVISRFQAQAFVTFCNISSVYRSYKFGLSVQTYYVTVGGWHKYKCTTVQAHYYALMRGAPYNDMGI